jgi:hypothetical protein
LLPKNACGLQEVLNTDYADFADKDILPQRTQRRKRGRGISNIQQGTSNIQGKAKRRILATEFTENSKRRQDVSSEEGWALDRMSRTCGTGLGGRAIGTEDTRGEDVSRPFGCAQGRLRRKARRVLTTENTEGTERGGEVTTKYTKHTKGKRRLRGFRMSHAKAQRRKKKERLRNSSH